MAIIKPQGSGNKQGKKFGGKSHGRKGGFGGGKGGGKGGFGGGKGAPPAGGQWMFIPAGAAPQFMGGGAPLRATYGKAAPQKFGGAPQRFGGGKGGQRFGKGAPMVVQSFGKFAGGKGGKGGGGKHKNQNPKQAKALDKLGKIAADCKVWIGGLAQDVNRGKLHAHFKDTVKPHHFELMSKGTACIAFKTPEDAQLAIDTFNGTELGGKDIQVDVWTQKEKKVRPEGEKRERPQKKKAGSVIKTSFLKGKKGNKDSPMKLKIKAVDHALKVWVGGLSEKTTWKQLKEHFVASGCEVDMCDMMKPGTACCTFKTEDDATSAVGIMSGTELDDSTIQVDVWTRPERREKKKKGEIKEEA